MKLDKKDESYGIYKEYIQMLLEDSGDMSELAEIKQLAATLTLANKMGDLEHALERITNSSR
jgi:hypothetical protein